MSPAWTTRTDEVRYALHAKGLDIVVPLRLRWYNDVAPPSSLITPSSGGARGDALVVLVGNSRALWPAFCAAHDTDPVIGDATHPVDLYVARSSPVLCLTLFCSLFVTVEEGIRFAVVFFFFKQETAYEISDCLVGSEMCIRNRSICSDMCSEIIFVGGGPEYV